MKNWIKIAAAAATLLLLEGLMVPIHATHPVSVGRFVQRLAQVARYDARDPRTALDSLRAAGVSLPADIDLSRPLTQAEVVELSARLGIRVTTSRPDKVLTEQQVDGFFRAFGGDLALAHSEIGVNPGQGSGPGNGNGGPPFDPYSKARGKGIGKAKFNRTPSGE